METNTPNNNSQPPLNANLQPQGEYSTTIIQQETGIKTAIIASIINVVLTFLLVSTFGIFASGVYLGLSKKIGNKTKTTFYLITFVFFFLYEGLIKNGFVDPMRGTTRAIIITALSSVMMAATPLGVMWVVKKVKKQ